MENVIQNVKFSSNLQLPLLACSVSEGCLFRLTTALQAVPFVTSAEICPEEDCVA